MSQGVILQLLLCPVVLFALLRVTAPYGRHFRPGWGPALTSRMAWFLMELPGLIVIGIVILAHQAPWRPVLWLPWAMWSAHYAYRTFIFPAMVRSTARSFPVSVVALAWGFNALNGYNNAHALIGSSMQAQSASDWHFLAGGAVFVAGFLLHASADARIRNLRRDDPAAYGIPRGGLFEYVTNPHYLGEIVQWTGWALMTWSWAGLAFAAFTACNLVPRAIANHRWYRTRFPVYPAKRRILVPFLY